ncbi:AP2-like ethylene-responsive transcription factor AIL6 [Nicotiana tabacum]|uniref:AP2-like ethylene-responsive transcription factor AIL6 n=1 Tax=Nicotiana tabacum TaxID=4097 RepID=A0AC58SFW3_TOBAC
MAPENNNWLSFSLSSMEMLNSSSPQSSNMLQSADSNHYYFADNNFFPHGWTNQKSQVMYSEGEKQTINDDSLIFYSQIHQQQQPPKLEDFLGGETTETQDSSLTHMYDHGGSATGAGYFNGGFQTFSANSASEVDDSHVMGTEFATESSNELGYSQYPTGALSLAVNTTTTTSEKAIVAVDSENCKKITDNFGQRTSIYRGVTRHRWTGRYEAHLWDNSCRREGQARKGRQVYLGGYDKEDKAAKAYDLAALKYWGPTATTNFPVSNYTKELEDMKHMTKQEFIASLRRKSSGFSRGASIYRGVTRHHQQGRWQARIGRVAGNKDLYLGTFATEEEAAEAYDIAAIKFRGVNAVTNFEMNRYDVEAIMKSALPIGGAAKRLKISLESEQKPSLNNNYQQQTQCSSVNSSSINFGPIPPVSAIPCGVPYDANQPFYHHSFFPHLPYSNNGGASDTSGAMTNMIAAMPLLQSPAEIFIWPHQSY